jgi:hypothetical protein
VERGIGAHAAESLAHVVRRPVAASERPSASASRAFRRCAEEPPFEKTQDRRVVVELAVDVAALSIRRGQESGNTKPGLPEVVLVDLARTRIRKGRRPHVVEEAPAFVVREHERSALPVRRVHEGTKDLANPALPELDVGVGMVVGAMTLSGTEMGFDEDHTGQVSRRRILEEPVQRTDERCHSLEGPERQ